MKRSEIFSQLDEIEQEINRGKVLPDPIRYDPAVAEMRMVRMLRLMRKIVILDK